MLCPVVLSKSGKQFEIFGKVLLLFTEVGKNQIASEGEGATDWRLKTLLGSRAWERIFVFRKDMYKTFVKFQNLEVKEKGDKINTLTYQLVEDWRD